MSIFDRLMRRGDGDLLWKDAVAELYENAAACKAAHPEDEAVVDGFLPLLEAECRQRYPRLRPAPEARQPLDAVLRFFLSKDRLTLYVCLLPPQYGGAALTVEQIHEELHEQGCVFGLLDSELAENAGNYLKPFPAARGVLPRDGVDGVLTELFERREDTVIKARANSVIDFSLEQPVQAVRRGEPICRRTPAVPGEDGIDVTGASTSAPRRAVEAELPAGKNTVVSADGLTLSATEDGVVYFKDDVFNVRPLKLISGSLTTPSGSCKVSGSCVITGDLSGGVYVEATGDLIIFGQVRDATACSTGGSVRVQKGVAGGTGKTLVKAAQQVQTPSVAAAEVESGGGIFTESIVNSEIRCGTSVLVRGGQGLILGGHVQAGRLVQCRQLGNANGRLTKVTVGYAPEDAAEVERLRGELASTDELLALLWKRIGELRKAGKLMNDEQRAVLEQLVEQRALYEQHQSDIKSRQKALRDKLQAAGSGRIICEKLFPVAELRIGTSFSTIRSQEENCSIHPYGDNLVLH